MAREHVGREPDSQKRKGALVFFCFLETKPGTEQILFSKVNKLQSEFS